MSVKIRQRLLILVCIFCQVASAIVLKLMPSRYVLGIVNDVFLIAGVLLVTRAWLWQLVLKDVDLSVAYSFNALTPVFILLVSWMLAGERLSLANLAGGVLIGVGIVAVSCDKGKA